MLIWYSNDSQHDKRMMSAYLMMGCTLLSSVISLFSFTSYGMKSVGKPTRLCLAIHPFVLIIATVLVSIGG